MYHVKKHVYMRTLYHIYIPGTVIHVQYLHQKNKLLWFHYILFCFCKIFQL